MDYKIEMDNFLKSKEGSMVTMAEKAFKWLTEPVSYEEKDMPDRVVTPWTKEEDVKWTKKKIPVRRYEQLINDGANVAALVYMGSVGLSNLARGIDQWRYNRAIDTMTQKFQAEMAKRSGQLAPENITRLLNWFQEEVIPQAAYAKTFPERGFGRVGMYAGVPMVPQEPSKKLPSITLALAQVTPALQPQGEGNKVAYRNTKTGELITQNAPLVSKPVIHADLLTPERIEQVEKGILEAGFITPEGKFIKGHKFQLSQPQKSESLGVASALDNDSYHDIRPGARKNIKDSIETGDCNTINEVLMKYFFRSGKPNLIKRKEASRVETK